MDKAKVVRKLNESLERELNEVVRYMHQSFWVKGKNAKKLRAFFREQSSESMGHATRLGEHIVALGGQPVVKILEIYQPRKMSDREMLLECVEHEQAALSDDTGLGAEVDFEEAPEPQAAPRRGRPKGSRNRAKGGQ
jgi:bacterioferritin (cytochrome b1)